MIGLFEAHSRGMVPPVVCSADTPKGLRRLGNFDLKGIAAVQEIFTLAPAV